MGVVGATWRRLRSLGRASLLPASACLPAFTRGPLYTTLHPQRPLSNAQICGLRPPSPDSPLFTRRLFQIGQNVKPKDGTRLKYREGHKTNFGAQTRCKSRFVDPLLCPGAEGRGGDVSNQNCRRGHLLPLRNCAEIELRSFFVDFSALSLSTFLYSFFTTSLTWFVLSSIFHETTLRLRSVFMDKQTAFCRD